MILKSTPESLQTAAPAPYGLDSSVRAMSGVLIEDDPSSLDFLHEMLLLWGYQVESYHDPADALQGLILRPEIPDFIVSDLRFTGGMNGFELIESLRAVHARHYIPAILITGDTNPAHADSAAALRIHLIHKPMRPSVLKDLLHKIQDASAAGALRS